jgi:formylglycine-generating enzyme required for sulfatase activity
MILRGFLHKTGFTALAFGAVLVFLSPLVSRADDCIDCHAKPRYKKEDLTLLKECLQCHGSEDHPYKEEASWWATARAAEAKEAGSRAASSGEVKADLESMVFIEEGEFLMGTDDRLRDEKPAHVVYVNAFYIDIYEVTNEDYKGFVVATGRKTPVSWERGTYPEGKGDHPATYVSWYDAEAYCKWAGKRLPREAEWEKAARGTDGRIYPWGNEWDLNKSNNPLKKLEGTVPVGSFEEGKNQFGLYDMSGNVWEWVGDGYTAHPGSDYANPEFGRDYGLLKGGSWWDCMFYGCGISAPTYNRAFFHPTTISDSYGFRCAADAE